MPLGAVTVVIVVLLFLLLFIFCMISLNLLQAYMKQVLLFSPFYLYRNRGSEREGDLLEIAQQVRFEAGSKSQDEAEPRSMW